MTIRRKKILIVLLTSLIFSIGASVLFPSNIGKESIITEVNVKYEQSIIDQGIEGISLKPLTVSKVFYKGNLLGILYDSSSLNKAIKKIENGFKGTKYEGAELKLSDDVYVLTQPTFWRYEDRDKEITSYLTNHNLFVTDAIEVTIENSDNEIIDTVYVKSEQDFSNALKKFAKCFIDEDVYNRLEKNEEIPSLSGYGTQEKNIYIDGMIKSTNKGAPVSEVLTSEDEVFYYLCYGDKTDLSYYTVEQYDTVDGIAVRNGLTAKQLMALNPDVHNVEQALAVGEKMLVTYFESPLNIVVEQERISKVVTYAGATQYKSTDQLPAGQMRKIKDAKNGYNDVTYTEIYVNGEFTSYRIEKTVVVEEPSAAVYEIGAGEVAYDPGNLNFQLPCDNPELICKWRCYTGHNGADFINYLNRYGNVLACESGRIVGRGYQSDMGYYYFIRHSNEYELDYMHMRVPGYYPPGTWVQKGQVIGQIGNTGRSSTPHVHIAVWYNGVRVDPCSPGLLPCQDAR